MKEHIRRNKAVIFFTFAWFALNLIQACFTEIIEDEAYYWLYSRFPAWGYFDHPPMVAFLIRLGYGIFPNELGVRLFHSLLGAGTIYLTWLLIPERSRNATAYILVVSAVSLMHLNASGFIALPDIPLVFFTALFFLILRNYLDGDRILQAVLLGIVVALMMYSKYHTLLILFFTLLADWKLILRKSFWVIVGVAVILYLPHILWQINHDFASFEYHLVSRSKPFQPRQIFEYLGNQVLVTGPFVGVILFWLALARKAAGSWERVLKFNLIGFFGFFLLSSARGHVEPHWTAAAFPPLIVLALINLDGYPRLNKWLRALSVASIPAILLIRAYLVWDFLPLPPNTERLFHEKDTWARQVEQVAGDRPVVFMNKFQNPSVYWFYTGKKAFTRNNVFYRRNQFDIWPIESELEGENVVLIRWTASDSTMAISTVRGDYHYYDIEKYCSFNRLKISTVEKQFEVEAGRDFEVSVWISNFTSKEVSLDCDCELSPRLMYTIIRKKERYFKYYYVEPQPEIGSLAPGEEMRFDLKLRAPAEPGSYKLLVSFGSTVLLPGKNGAPASLEVTPGNETGLAYN